MDSFEIDTGRVLIKMDDFQIVAGRYDPSFLIRENFC